MIVQAEGGKALARKKLEVAEQALTTIAETGRESLYEMRRTSASCAAARTLAPISPRRPACATSPTW